MSRYGWLHEKKPYPADGEEHARCARADASEAVSESPVEQVLPNKGNEAETHSGCQHVEHSSHVVHIQLAAHYLVLLIVADPSQPLSLQLLHLTWGETHTPRPMSSISSVYNWMYTSVGRSTTVHRYIFLFQISPRVNMSKWGSVKLYTQALAIWWHHLRLFFSFSTRCSCQVNNSVIFHARHTALLWSTVYSMEREREILQT